MKPIKTLAEARPINVEPGAFLAAFHPGPYYLRTFSDAGKGAGRNYQASGTAGETQCQLRKENKMNAFIKKIQTALNDRGYGPLKVDGKDGPKTQKAVAAFQKYSGREPDGLVGPLTENRLFREQLSVISLDGDGATPHFAKAEFACDCQGAYCDGFPGAMDLWLMLKLEALRNALDSPVIITSGLRCEIRNGEVGGIPRSKHRIGQAADLYAPGIDIERVASIAESLGLTTILYLEQGFVHCEV